MDFASSSIVLCCKRGLFGQGNLDSQIYRAYCSYMEYCTAFKKTTACKPWTSHKELDMANQNDFPSTLKGKGFDTALVCAWISVFLDSQDIFLGYKKNNLKVIYSMLNAFGGKSVEFRKTQNFNV